MHLPMFPQNELVYILLRLEIMFGAPNAIYFVKKRKIKRSLALLSMENNMEKYWQQNYVLQ